MLLDNALSLCCGGNPLVSTAMNLLGKNKKDDDEDVAASKPQQQQQSQSPNRNNIVKMGAFTGAQTKYTNMEWKRLNVRARKAAETLGYTQQTWDNDEWVDIVDYHWWDFTQEQKLAAETMGWDEPSWETHYEDYSWQDLPKIVQKAATAAGITQTMWDDDEWPENLHKNWEDLTAKERDAMAVLGWGKTSWNH